MINKLNQHNEHLREKLNKYEKLDTSKHALLKFSCQEIMKSLNEIEPSIEIVLRHFTDAYDEVAVIPIVTKLFGSKISVDPKALEK